MIVGDIVKRIGYGDKLYEILGVFGDMAECRGILRDGFEERCNITYYINMDELIDITEEVDND